MKKIVYACLICMINFILLTGCSSSSNSKSEHTDLPLRDNTPKVLETIPLDDRVEESEVVSLYLSNVSKGYIMFVYKGSNEKVKLQITGPDEVTYTYLVTDCKEPTAFPLASGSGEYMFNLFESVDAENNKYYMAYSYNYEVTIEDEFLPYLSPNVYVNFTSESNCVAKCVDLAANCYSDLDVIEEVYNYVISNVIYDTEEAKDVAYGYIPNPDEVLATNKGICFDYASLMTAMLRSQNIPTKLEVGYAGEVYHAWISCYVDEIGWVANIIQFDGENWSLMDPTLASNNNSAEVQEYIGDGSKYVVKYTY